MSMVLCNASAWNIMPEPVYLFVVVLAPFSGWRQLPNEHVAESLAVQPEACHPASS